MSLSERSAGRLVVCPTPIGNLGDLSPRGRDALATADLVLCEDTRHTARLLAAIGVGRALGLDARVIAAALAKFLGVDRRF